MYQTDTEKRSASLIAAFDSLLAAPSACKNYRAILLMGMTSLAAMLVFALFGFLATKTGHFFIAGLGSLLAFLIGFYGANAVGILMMQEVQGQQPDGLKDVLMASLLTSHRLLAIALFEFFVVVAAVIVIAVVLFICKIPGLGAFLFMFVLPASAVILGVLVFALFYIMLPLAGPAVWSGSTIFQVLAQLNAIVRKKIMSVMTQQIVLLIIVMFISSIVFAIVTMGLMMASGLAAPIVGVADESFSHLYSSMHGYAGRSAYVFAGAMGGGFLFALAAVIPGLIMIKGICIMYLNVTHGLDFVQAEAALASGMADIKKKTEAARERARQLAERSSNISQPPSTIDSQETAALFCPDCRSSVLAEDAFCGNCGKKLK